MFLLFQGIIFRFQPLIFQGVMEKKGVATVRPPKKPTSIRFCDWHLGEVGTRQVCLP